MAESFSIKFYLNKNKTKGKQFKIYGRLIIERRKAEFATSFFIEEDKWNKAQGRAKKNTAINDELAEIESEINRLRRKLLDEDKPVSSKIIVELLKGERKEKRYLIEYLDEHIREMKQKDEHAENTYNHYTSSRNIYAEFLNEKLQVKDILLTSIDLEFLKKYDMYMISEYRDPRKDQKIVRNTVNKHHSRLRTILHKAVRESIIKFNPYKDFPLTYAKTNRTFLTQEEVQRIRDIDFSNNEILDQIRDIFLFSCFTSLRYKDAAKLTIKHIVDKADGQRAIYIMQSNKTKEPVYVPIIQQAQAIIDKYENHPEREIKGYILPQYSNQKFNAYLKNIAVLANISKKLSHHVSRHTFATTALNNGIPLEVVQKILAHQNIRTTQIYAKLLTSTVDMEMNKFKL
jgi:site-specific recombinase XerD